MKKKLNIILYLFVILGVGAVLLGTTMEPTSVQNTREAMIAIRGILLGAALGFGVSHFILKKQ